MKQTIQELEKELSKARRVEHEQKRRDDYKKEQEFKAKENINLYTSSDYAGLENGKYSFYYGYEHTRCLVKQHGVSCVDDSRDPCEDAEWCFVAKQGNKEIFRMVQSQLWWETGETPFFYLLAGIGHFLKKVSD